MGPLEEAGSEIWVSLAAMPCGRVDIGRVRFSDARLHRLWRSVGARWYTCTVLLELRVENLLLIERAELALAPGLNVLTGETGAGKTVLAHALDLLLGGRPRTGIVRPGAMEAYVEGVFSLPAELLDERGERLPADAEEVVLARRVGADGRTRAYVNGRSAAVGDLRALGELLVAFYGQHEHRKLTLSAAQLQILDGFCGPGQTLRLRECAVAYDAVRGLQGELEGLRELALARERELDLLEHELAEIDGAEPAEGEHERLLADRERLRRLDALRAAAGFAMESLAPESAEAAGATQLLAQAVAAMEGVSGVDPQLDALAERCRVLAIEAGDLAGELRGYGEGLEDEDGALEAMEVRLQALERLLRKHGGTTARMLEYAAAARARREELLGAEVALAQVTERLAAALEVFEGHVSHLRQARMQAAPQLTQAVCEQLSALAMPDATFEVALRERDPGPSGADVVELLIAPNPGVAAGPLRDIASGGELSRVMLALVTASSGVALAPASSGGARVANADSDVALVFDEVDAGIGGHTARAVGERLRDLAQGRQVICITHLHQIASLAARHFSVVKDTQADLTCATVVQLGERETVSELMRMMGAADTDTSARKHARELRKAA
jgi:DNA repair protein RecN (Recombination protein N)